MRPGRRSPSGDTLRTRLRERYVLLAEAAEAPERVDARLVAKLAKARKLSWREERRHVRRVLRVAIRAAKKSAIAPKEVTP